METNWEQFFYRGSFEEITQIENKIWINPLNKITLGIMNDNSLKQNQKNQKRKSIKK